MILIYVEDHSTMGNLMSQVTSSQTYNVQPCTDATPVVQSPTTVHYSGLLSRVSTADGTQQTVSSAIGDGTQQTVSSATGDGTQQTVIITTGGETQQIVSSATGDGTQETVSSATGDETQETVSSATGGETQETVSSATGDGTQQTVIIATGGGTQQTASSVPGGWVSSSQMDGVPLTTQDENVLKYFVMLRRTGPTATVLAKVCRELYGGGQQSVKEYYTNDLGFSNAQYRKAFATHERDAIEAGIEWEQLDITYLYKLLQRVCGLASPSDDRWSNPKPKDRDGLEYILFTIKGERNFLAHEVVALSDVELKTRSEKLKVLLEKVLEKTELITGGDYAQYIIEMKAAIDDTYKCKPKYSLQSYQRELKEFLHDLVNKVIIKSQTELHQIYQRLWQEDRIWLHFGFGSHSPQLEEVFTNITILTKNNCVVPVLQILDYELPNGSLPKLIVLEGVAGVGKSHICKYILNCWASKNSNLMAIKNTDIMIFIQCHSVTSSSLTEFLGEEILKETCKELKYEDIIPTLRECHVIFIIDGLDEAGKHARSLVRAISTKFPASRVVVTCRPEFTEEAKCLISPSSNSLNVFYVKGFNETQQIEYIEKLLTVLEGNAHKRENMIQKLTDHLKLLDQEIYHFLNLPLTVMLLTLLWLQDSTSFTGAVTVTYILRQSVNLSIKRLAQRLLQKAEEMRHIMLVEQACQQWLLCLAKVAWESLLCNTQILYDESWTSYLLQEAQHFNIDPIDAMSSFLKCTTHEIQFGTQYTWEFPHRAYQEYLSALHLSEVKKNSALDEIMKEPKKFKKAVNRAMFPRSISKGNQNLLLGSSSITHPFFKSSLPPPPPPHLASPTLHFPPPPPPHLASPTLHFPPRPPCLPRRPIRRSRKSLCQFDCCRSLCLDESNEDEYRFEDSREVDFMFDAALNSSTEEISYDDLIRGASDDRSRFRSAGSEDNRCRSMSRSAEANDDRSRSGSEDDRSRSGSEDDRSRSMSRSAGSEDDKIYENIYVSGLNETFDNAKTMNQTLRFLVAIEVSKKEPDKKKIESIMENINQNYIYNRWVFWSNFIKDCAESEVISHLVLPYLEKHRAIRLYGMFTRISQDLSAIKYLMQKTRFTPKSLDLFFDFNDPFPDVLTPLLTTLGRLSVFTKIRCFIPQCLDLYHCLFQQESLDYIMVIVCGSNFVELSSFTQLLYYLQERDCQLRLDLIVNDFQNIVNLAEGIANTKIPVNTQLRLYFNCLTSMMRGPLRQIFESFPWQKPLSIAFSHTDLYEQAGDMQKLISLAVLDARIRIMHTSLEIEAHAELSADYYEKLGHIIAGGAPLSIVHSDADGDDITVTLQCTRYDDSD
ncbi:uncharacterized protein LOC121862128 isoform X2 [Homarus americanus]|uniref:uncharacterized protein LOC121862128 isoform X2 n=1 Tax=Homarus americanus TaxID=6706 RepID=UPI001C445804|nr:uncharacterized protein LOC121862128 isoform X2 [Homarus americanus]